MRPSENRDWLKIDGWCSPIEGDALYDAACALPEHGHIVEIGTWLGRSAVALASSHRYVTTIDDVPQPELMAELAKFSINIEVIEGDSRASAKEHSTPVDFLYIDGWHDAENVRADYAAWAPHVVPNGLIWFHDAHGASWPDVTALVDELVASGDLALDGYVGTIAKCRKAVRHA